MNNDNQYMEVNFDGLVGANHNYAGLSFGNIASQSNKQIPSNPRRAAIQGLEKMRTLISMGLKQGFFTPLIRPDFEALHNWGFRGSSADMLEAAYRFSPGQLAFAWSASSMWAANSATYTPSSDSNNGKVNITIANLSSMPHRALEHAQTHKLLSDVFNSKESFIVNKALEGGAAFSDEGAANHMRMGENYGDKSLNIFAYGKDGNEASQSLYPERQSLLSFKTIACSHQISDDNCLYLKQKTQAINAGAFHNDVVAVSNQNVLFYHEHAFDAPDELEKLIEDKAGFKAYFIRVLESEVSLNEAVKSYLFNSQIITKPNGKMCFIFPIEVEEQKSTLALAKKIIEADNPIDEFRIMNLRESMRNGGGPACLRFRAQLNSKELKAVNQKYLLDNKKIDRLIDFVKTHYRDHVSLNDLRDAKFADEVINTHEALYKIIEKI